MSQYHPPTTYDRKQNTCGGNPRTLHSVTPKPCSVPLWLCTSDRRDYQRGRTHRNHRRCPTLDVCSCALINLLNSEQVLLRARIPQVLQGLGMLPAHALRAVELWPMQPPPVGRAWPAHIDLDAPLHLVDSVRANSWSAPSPRSRQYLRAWRVFLNFRETQASCADLPRDRMRVTSWSASAWLVDVQSTCPSEWT